MAIILLVYNEPRDQNSYVAEHSSHSLPKYASTQQYITAALIPLLILNTLMQAVFAFSTYITIQDREYLLILIYTFDLFFIISAVIALYYITDCLHLATLPNAPKPSSTLLHLAFWEVILVVFLLAIPTYFINYFRK